MTKWIIKFHPKFFKDLERISKREVILFNNKKKKVIEDPTRLKHLSGGPNCYRMAITQSVRAIYLIKENVIWFLHIGKHKNAYKKYLKRLYDLEGIKND